MDDMIIIQKKAIGPNDLSQVQDLVFLYTDWGKMDLFFFFIFFFFFFFFYTRLAQVGARFYLNKVEQG